MNYELELNPDQLLLSGSISVVAAVLVQHQRAPLGTRRTHPLVRKALTKSKDPRHGGTRFSARTSATKDRPRILTRRVTRSDGLVPHANFG